MNIINKLKNLFCFHKYNNEQLFYKIEYCYKQIDNAQVHKLTLYNMRKCIICNKIEIKEQNSFHVYCLEHLKEIKTLVEHRGAIPYYQMQINLDKWI